MRNMILIGLVAMCLIGTTPVQALQEKEGKIGVIVRGGSAEQKCTPKSVDTSENITLRNSVFTLVNANM